MSEYFKSINPVIDQLQTMIDDNQKVIDYRARFVQSISVLVGLPVDTEDLMDQALALGDDPIIGASVISLLDEYDKVNKIAQFDAQELNAIKLAIDILKDPTSVKVTESHVAVPEEETKEVYTAPEISVEEEHEEPVEVKEVKEDEKVEKSTDSFPTCEIPHGFHEIDSGKWQLKGRYAVATDGRVFNLGTGRHTGSAVPTDDGFVLEIEGKKLRFSDIISGIFGIEKKNDVARDTTSEPATAVDDAATESEQAAAPAAEERCEEEQGVLEPVMITWIKGVNPNKYKLFPDGRVYNYVTGKSLIQCKGMVKLSSTMCSTGERTGAINHINRYKVSDLLEHAYGKKK